MKIQGSEMPQSSGSEWWWLLQLAFIIWLSIQAAPHALAPPPASCRGVQGGRGPRSGRCAEGRCRARDGGGEPQNWRPGERCLSRCCPPDSADLARAPVPSAPSPTALCRTLPPQVFLHLAVLSGPSGAVLQSTRADQGGAGAPQPFVLGHGAARALRGVELALATTRLRERCVLEIRPEYAYRHPDCSEAPPEGLRRDAAACLDLQLVAWLPGHSARSVDASPGVFARTLREGEGWETPRPPFEVRLHVEARGLASDAEQQGGPLYFSSRVDAGDGAPLTVDLGSGALPPGLEAAVCTMQRGQQAVVWCPAAAARGGAAVPSPPPAQSSYVEFVVSLVDFLQVRDLLGDGAAVKRTLRKGRGDFPADCPLEDAALQLHLRVKPAGAPAWAYDSRTASGDAADEAAPLAADTGTGALPECVDAAVRLMLRGEVAGVRSSWARSYAGRDDAPPGLPAGSPVEMEVELVDFEPEPNWADLDDEGRLARAAKWKEQGNAVFKAGRYRLARQKYLKGIRCVDQAMGLETEAHVAAAAATKVACLVNLAACAQREQEFGEVVTWCTKALR